MSTTPDTKLEAGKKANYWKSVADQLDRAYDEIITIKQDHKSADDQLSRVLRGTSWKGKSRDQFEQLLDELENNIDTHYTTIDGIHDAINKEVDRAKDNYSHFLKIFRDIGTGIENITN